jgi:hypothetical protein
MKRRTATRFAGVSSAAMRVLLVCCACFVLNGCVNIVREAKIGAGGRNNP